jgi:hypothetical protein
MLDEHQRRNHSPGTARGELPTCYRGVHQLFSPVARSVGPDPVREYQVHVFHDRKLSPHSIEGQAAALQLPLLKTIYCGASLPTREPATHLLVNPVKESGTQMDHPVWD